MSWTNAMSVLTLFLFLGGSMGMLVFYPSARERVVVARRYYACSVGAICLAAVGAIGLLQTKGQASATAWLVGAGYVLLVLIAAKWVIRLEA